MPRRTSKLAVAVRDVLRARDESLSTRQIERLGGAGLLGPTAEDRDRPTSAGYVSSLADRASDAAALVRRYRRLDFATLVMFVRSEHAVAKHKIDEAYASAL